MGLIVLMGVKGDVMIVDKVEETAARLKDLPGGLIEALHAV